MAMLNHQMVILVAQLMLQLNLLTWCVFLQFALAYCWCWGGVGCSNVRLNLLARLMLRWRWGCVGVVWKQTSIDVLFPLVCWLIEGLVYPFNNRFLWWYVVYQTGPSIFTKRTLLQTSTSTSVSETCGASRQRFLSVSCGIFSTAGYLELYCFPLVISSWIWRCIWWPTAWSVQDLAYQQHVGFADHYPY